MMLNHLKLQRGISFMKHLPSVLSVVSSFFLLKTLIWSKESGSCIRFAEIWKSGGKLAKEGYFWKNFFSCSIYHWLM